MDAVDSAADLLACTRCVGDDRLRAEARSSGFDAECAYCGKAGTCVDVAWLADRVHPAIQSVFAPAEAGTTGPVLDGAGATATAAGLEAALARDVHRTLVALFHEADGSAMYPAECAYVARPARGLPALHCWTTFAAAAERAAAGADDELLDTLKWAFSGLDALASAKGRSALRVLEAGTRAFEARLPVGLDALPSTGAGALNCAGVPALYLALRARTAVTESLAPRGARVVVTRVRLTRAVRVLELETARKALARAGCLDPDRAGSRLRAAFLDGFADALRWAPVRSSGDPPWRATRRVGDWLAHGASPRLDGLLARAAHGPGRTLTLLAPACTTGAVLVEREQHYEVGSVRAKYRRVSPSRSRTPGPRTPPVRD